ncbi:hypothetical protein EV127DRAFT_33776 [Xylaria flabelliformis]|nr:hypothetical protein EV127DRAFT_33776 [Xylaria flabelliformis]
MRPRRYRLLNFLIHPLKSLSTGLFTQSVVHTYVRRPSTLRQPAIQTLLFFLGYLVIALHCLSLSCPCSEPKTGVLLVGVRVFWRKFQ